MKKVEEVFSYYNEELKMKFEIVKELSTNVCKVRKVTYDPYADYPNYHNNMVAWCYIKRPNIQFTVCGDLTETVFLHELNKRNRLDKIKKQLRNVSQYLIDLRVIN